MSPFAWFLIFLLIVALFTGIKYLPDYVHQFRLKSREIELMDLEINERKARQRNEELSGYLSEEEKEEMRRKAENLQRQ